MQRGCVQTVATQCTPSASCNGFSGFGLSLVQLQYFATRQLQYFNPVVFLVQSFSGFSIF